MPEGGSISERPGLFGWGGRGGGGGQKKGELRGTVVVCVFSIEPGKLQGGGGISRGGHFG